MTQFTLHSLQQILIIWYFCLWALNFISATFFCFFSLVAYSFKEKEKKPRKFSVCVALGFIKDAVSTLLLFCLSFYLDKCQTLSLFHHQAKCCECFHPSPTHNVAGLSAVLPLCFLQPPQTLLQRCIAPVLCKLSSS